MLVLSSSLDREVQAHKHFTGATNIYWLNELMRYVRSEGLLNGFRLYPMVARTNYGTGVTVRGLGKLTGNQMTLVNGPTWGASGIAFASASSQYGTIADFLASETLTVFNRLTLDPAPPLSITRLYGHGDSVLGSGSIALSYAGNSTGDPYRIYRTSGGTVATGEFYDTSDETQTTGDQCLVNQWVSGGGRAMWQNKTSLTLTLLTGTPQTSKFNSSANFIYNGIFSNGSLLQPSDQTGKALAFLTGSVTTTQRETITDLCNLIGEPGYRTNGLDIDVYNYRETSGATDVSALNTLVKYVKKEGLWMNFRLYPMKSAQNAGTGTTAYGIGGLTGNDMTLVNGPTWGASGVSFDGLDDYATVNPFPSFRVSDGCVLFARFAFETESNSDTFSSTNPRYLMDHSDGSDVINSSFLFRVIGGRANLSYRNSADTAYLSTISTNHDIDTQDLCVTSHTSTSGTTSLFLDKTEVSSYSSQDTGTGKNVSDRLFIGAQSGDTRFFSGDYKAAAVLTGSVTTAQRETITDLINAL